VGPRDALVLGVLWVGVAAALSARADLEPRLSALQPVEVVGSVPAPGVHLAPPTVGAAIRAAGGLSRDNTKLPPGSRIEVRSEGVRVLAAHDPLLLGERVDLNRAGGPALDTLPRVGPHLASAILARRARAGAFHAVGELRWVSGVGPSLLAAIDDQVTVGAIGPRPPRAPLDLNRATPRELERLPGIGPTRAAAIVDDRRAHGPFDTVDALARVRGVGPVTVARIAERVTVSP